ncbi:T3SS effector HopA1 family protein [Streptomyces sp. MUM 2J]|uniref:T3SS effector HopA1 family protein n=1 Tax=Streptomyces sp. MUM 2J TaxID=2791987 RepID=UPI001F041367|nr:T3SS effector HopA1 family protein [Streptomyces sp. MUM 2J]MCH0562847.1 hypothetical protein [Streptomyces sp. MUM 2J]
MTTTAPRVSGDLLRALDSVQVAEGATEATALDEELTAESPSGLVSQLRTSLYRRLHAGMDKQDSPRARSLRDNDLDARYTAAMPHSTTLVPATVLDGRNDQRVITAVVEGVRTRVPGSCVVKWPQRASGPALLRLPAQRPGRSPGFFLTDSSRGLRTGAATLRMYIHLTDRETAPQVWGVVLERLEALGLRYRSKVTSNGNLLPRRDGLVIYLGPDAWDHIAHVADAVRGVKGLGDITSPFVHRLAPGIGAAWEPRDHRPGKRGLSFGEHRSQVLAEALVAQTLSVTSRTREVCVAESLIDAGVDPLFPARNLSSPTLPGFGLA